ncbi:hypothetical protein H0194_04600 [Corynebacterium incognita]|uniref:Phage minor capsid protein 2 n=1 Tax=Corynebacterium incognita TaxID=2754725 RepID=A0A7G7CRP7_9CORY|nr:phage minor capsid protein [Corynebacterium incognita]QNE90263.1 hypothetical protein H0194_04600 [Corynebacterium incognita]
MVFDAAKVSGLETTIVDIYARAELYLIQIIRDALIAAGESPTWAEAQLLAIRQQQGRIQGLAATLQKQAPALYQDVVARAFLRGQIEAEKEILTLPTIESANSLINDTAVYAIAGEQVGIMSEVHKSILRRTDDIWRAITAEATGMALTGTMTTFDAAQRAFTRMARDGMGFYRDAAGRKWGLDTYAEMAIRHATNQAMRVGHTETYLQHGIDLVVISSHKNPAPQCAPYERKVISLTGKFPAGTHRIGDNIVDVKATMRDAEASGLHHPNCRHHHSAYIPGYTNLQPVTPPDDDHAGYKATQKQRYYERQIRASKRMEAAAINDKDIKAARQRTRTYQAKLRDHIAEHDLPRRRHREQMRTPKHPTPRGGGTSLTQRLDPVTIPTPATPVAPTPVEPRRRGRRAGQGGLSVADIMKQNDAPVANVVASKASVSECANIPDLPAPRLKETTTKTLASLPKTADKSWNAITKQANGEARYNCIRVASAVEMRRRGYDVTAGNSTFRPDSRANQDLVASTHKARRDLERNPARPTTADIAIGAWKTKDGQRRILVGAPEAKKGIRYGKNGATVKMFEDEMPDGASGFAVCKWKKDNAGHIWNWEKQDGKIRFFEAQTRRGFIDNDDYLPFASAGTLRMVRVDDLVPTDDVLKVIDIDNT